MINLQVNGVVYEVRPGNQCIELVRDGFLAGTVRQVSPTELELTRGFYRINAGSMHALAKKEYEDHYGSQL